LNGFFTALIIKR